MKTMGKKGITILLVVFFSLALITAGTQGRVVFPGTGKINIYTTSVSNLSQMNDVNIPSPTNGYVLTYNSTSGQWYDASATAVGDTNETTRFENLVGTDCTGTDKVIGVDVNGNLVCDTDQDSGGGGGGNTTEQMTDAVLGQANGTIQYDDAGDEWGVNQSWLTTFIEDVITAFVDAPFVNALFPGNDLTTDQDTNLSEADVEGYVFDNDNTGTLRTNGNLNVTSGNDICIEGGNCLSEAGVGTGDITAVNTAGDYLTGGSTSGDVNLLLDETKLNATIDARDSDTNLSEADVDAYADNNNYLDLDTYPNADTDSTDDFDGAFSSLTGVDSDACSSTDKVTNVTISNGVLTIVCDTDVEGSGDPNQTLSYDAPTDQITLSGGGGTIDITEVDTQLSQEQVEDYVGGMANGSLMYDDPNGILFVNQSWYQQVGEALWSILTWDYDYNDLINRPTHLSNFTDDILWTAGFNATFDVRDQDTNLSEDDVEAYIFDNDNTANLNISGYNVTGDYFCLNAGCSRYMYDNGTGVIIHGG